MSDLRVAVFGEGEHEVGRELGAPVSPEKLPALPRVVRRILGSPPRVWFVPFNFKHGRVVHGRGYKLRTKTIRAIREAQRQECDAVAIVIDRDRQPDSQTIGQLREARDSLAGEAYPPCAVGQAIETFDAWMIADGKAVGAAGGDPARANPNPESLRSGPRSPKHPKRVADAIFGTRQGIGLGPKYKVVAGKVDLSLLEKTCPQGFQPFSEEVQERIGPVVAES